MLPQDTSAHKVAASILGPRSKPVLYAKHMAKHKIGLDQSLMQRATHMVGGAVLGPLQPSAAYSSSSSSSRGFCDCACAVRLQLMRCSRLPVCVCLSHGLSAAAVGA